MIARFFSTSNFELIEEQIDYRYPSNQMEIDKADMTITFNGARPNEQTMDLLKGMGADIEE